MRCHYCDREADIAVEKDGIRIGVCEPHFRERMQELAEGDGFDELKDELDIDSE